MLRVTSYGLSVAGCELEVNGINKMIGVIFVGAAFQPRLNDHNVRATSFVAGKPLPRTVDVDLRV